jgi:tRNA A37 threonylcarbamoyladenosine dehydratase
MTRLAYPENNDATAAAENQFARRLEFLIDAISQVCNRAKLYIYCA